MTTLEPCTTWSNRLQHLSADLLDQPNQLKVGRIGHVICGLHDTAYDQDGMDSLIRSYGRRLQPRIASLPACKKCAKKATS